MENGANLKNAKLFMNCIHEPLFQDKDGEYSDVLIMNVVPPAELHLLLGPVNKMYDELEKLWPEVSAWAKGCKGNMHVLSFMLRTLILICLAYKL